METIKTQREVLIFDMAGTVVNEDNIVYKTMYQTCLNHGMNLSFEDVLTHGAGKEKKTAFQDLIDVKQVSLDADLLFQSFKKSLATAYESADVKSFISESTLHNLKKNYTIVFNTGYDKKTATKLLEKLGWEHQNEYDLLVCSNDVARGRPNPDMILFAMQHLGIQDPSKILKAGDTQIDILEGKNASCGITVGVLSGAQTKEELLEVNPDYILESLEDLDQVLSI